jgi:hypothetical protein
MTQTIKFNSIKNAFRFSRKYLIILGIPFVLFTLFLLSCSSSKKESDSFTIHGHFSNCTGEKILLEEMDINSVIPLDSTTVDPSGNIQFSHKTDQAGFYLIKLPGNKRIILLLDKSETLEIIGDCQKPVNDLVLKGSPGTMILSDFYKATNRNNKIVDSLKTVLQAQEGSPDFLKISNDADQLFRQIAENQRNLELGFLSRYPNSLACLIILNFTFGPRPILDIDHDFTYYQKADSILSHIYPANKHVLYHHQRIMEKKREEIVKRLNDKPVKKNK